MNSQITKLAFCLLCLLICTTSINAWTVTSFPTENFWVIDYTFSAHNNPNIILGYQYQMTDTAFYMRSAIWNNKHKIDLNKNFVLDFKLYFDRGLHWNYQLEPGDRYHSISDGMCFVLHTKDSKTTKDSILGTGLGYWLNQNGISYVYTTPITESTFAVE